MSEALATNSGPWPRSRPSPRRLRRVPRSSRPSRPRACPTLRPDPRWPRPSSSGPRRASSSPRTAGCASGWSLSACSSRRACKARAATFDASWEAREREIATQLRAPPFARAARAPPRRLRRERPAHHRWQAGDLLPGRSGARPHRPGDAAPRGRALPARGGLGPRRREEPWSPTPPRTRTRAPARA